MDFQEKKLSSKVVYEGKVITVERDDVELATGKKSFREVARHPGGVVILALKDSETILLVTQFRYPIMTADLELPAGKLERGEDPDLAAKRELEEETGYRAKNWFSLGYIYTTPGFCDEKLYLYKAEGLEFVGEHPDEGEIIKAFEISKTELMQKIKTGEINDAKTICAILRGLC
ncbi:MAG: NUDIX hydrolase [Candidatus Gastranaerophilaceae bacterium]|nr:NUDIX hydrolase [Candidatus Gastranaerophilaceae bacterium]